MLSLTQPFPHQSLIVLSLSLEVNRTKNAMYHVITKHKVLCVWTLSVFICTSDTEDSFLKVFFKSIFVTFMSTIWYTMLCGSCYSRSHNILAAVTTVWDAVMEK